MQRNTEAFIQARVNKDILKIPHEKNLKSLTGFYLFCR